MALVGLIQHQVLWSHQDNTLQGLYGREPPMLLLGERDSTVEQVQVLLERNHMPDGLKS